MSTDLEALLDEQDAEHSQLQLATTQVRTFISALAREMDFGTATLEERDEVAEILESLKAIEVAARARRQVIEQGIIDAAAKLGAREFRIEHGAVRVESRSEYVTRDAAMHDALTQLIALGDVTKTEVEQAIRTEVHYTPDHRHLNALLKRGGRVQEAIESNRERHDGRPFVKINRKGGAK